MGIFDATASGVMNEIHAELYDVNAAGTFSQMAQTWDVNAAGTFYSVWKRRYYLVKDGVAQVPWSAASGEVNINAIGYNTSGHYGFSQVVGSAATQQAVDVVALATTNPVDFADYSSMTFVFQNWANDNAGVGGYYHTGAGIYSNRTVARGGWDGSFPIKPASALKAWICSDVPNGASTQVMWLEGMTSGYVGLSSGGGFRGNGAILVSDIYLE